MGGRLLLSVAVLACVLLASVFILIVDNRRQRQAHRLDSAISGDNTLSDTPSDDYSSIRIEAPRSVGFRDWLARWSCAPVDTPLAHVVPPWLVVSTGIAGSILVGLFMRFLSSSSLLGMVLGIVSLLFLIRQIFGWERERYAQRLLAQLPDTIQLVGSATRAGLPVSEAARAVAREMQSPTRDEFVKVTRDLGLGQSVDQALMNLHFRTGVTEYAIFAVTLAVQARTGGRLSETIQNLAEIIRQRLAIAARATALSAEAKLSARVISVMPFIGGVMMTLIQPGYLLPLFNDPRGKHMLMVGVITMTLGVITMRQLIKGVTRE